MIMNYSELGVRGDGDNVKGDCVIRVGEGEGGNRRTGNHGTSAYLQPTPIQVGA